MYSKNLVALPDMFFQNYYKHIDTKTPFARFHFICNHTPNRIWNIIRTNPNSYGTFIIEIIDFKTFVTSPEKKVTVLTIDQILKSRCPDCFAAPKLDSQFLGFGVKNAPKKWNIL